MLHIFSCLCSGPEDETVAELIGGQPDKAGTFPIWLSFTGDQEMERQKSSQKQEWLVFFYSIPAKPPGGRTKIWRKLARIGAVRIKSAVYILPYSEDHHEILQWLIAELSSLGGDGALVRTETVEPFRQEELRELFNNRCIELYDKLTGRLSGLEQKLELAAKEMQVGRNDDLVPQVNKLLKELYRVKKIDFFRTDTGVGLEARMQAVKKAADQMTGLRRGGSPGFDNRISRCRREDFQGRIWLTRKNPFVDRMASAWLIRRYIDGDAEFGFIDKPAGPDQKAQSKEKKQVTYDIKNGDFTHVGQLCTFEVLCKSFGVEDHAVLRIGRMVHDIDLNDEKYGVQGAEGVKLILTGIRKRAVSDQEALEKGMEIFEALHMSSP